MCCFPCWLVSFLEYIWFLVVSCKRCNLFFFLSLSLSPFISVFSSTLYSTESLSCALRTVFVMLVRLCLLLLLLFWNSCLLVLRITYIFIFVHSDDSEWFSLCSFFGTAHSVRIYRELMQSYCTRILYSHWQCIRLSSLFSLNFSFLRRKATHIQPLICFEKWTLSRSSLINSNLTNDRWCSNKPINSLIRIDINF